MKMREMMREMAALAAIVASHAALYLLWFAVHHQNGRLDVWRNGYFDTLPSVWTVDLAPTREAVAIYFAFFVAQMVLAVAAPGVVVPGFPVPSLYNRRLPYLCNGWAAWLATIAIGAVGHLCGWLDVGALARHSGQVMTVAVLWADFCSLALHVTSVNSVNSVNGWRDLFSPYRFFMGGHLNPRPLRGLAPHFELFELFELFDLKFFAEIRVTWYLLAAITVSAAVEQHRIYGYVTPSMAIVVLAQLLYANACAKGEECVPTTWDIFEEKFGFMLCFWNFAGVPFLYSIQAQYLLNAPPFILPTWVTCLLVSGLLAAYYVWDTSQSQKNRYRAAGRNGVGTALRWTWPQFSYGTLERPRTLNMGSGRTVLVDGWWRYARKPHYTADIVMALVWGLACGLDAAAPYFYFVFFTLMIVHRQRRDEARCRAKYGDKAWDAYCAHVPFVFIPYLV